MLVSGASLAVAAHSSNPRLGQLITPAAGNAVRGDLPWAADNGCFGGLDAAAFCRMLARLPGGALFVVAPDVVADHGLTLALWHEWRAAVAAHGPVAFVAQDGCDAIPDDAGALFVGGSTAFKLGPQARDLVREAKARGLWVHMGRVNTKRRVMYAHAIGCDSIDGTSASMFPDIYVPRLLRWAEAAERQGAMFQC